MTEDELQKIIEFVNEKIESYISTDDSYTNDLIHKGFFSMEDFKDVFDLTANEQFISVQESLPPASKILGNVSEMVLATDNGNHYKVCRYSHHNHEWQCDFKYDVTHWMELPKKITNGGGRYE